KPVRTTELQAAIERWKPPAGRTGAAINPDIEPARTSAPVTPQAAPVDMELLREMAGDDVTSLREMVDLYLTQADDLMGRLRIAIEGGSAKDIARLAHSFQGSSSSCGMNSIVAPLRELERMGKAGELPANDRLITEVTVQLERIRIFLNTQVPPG
ncbi:MAG TPA: Hpt domain-containing protein, partial [Roseimicrobium sp.]|nr:Hpt domain-containing protein [Roseimicrobium sp.]